jgi:peptidoglycan/xylan/chitin deacetylase (PgdA/CDA1 family)
MNPQPIVLMYHGVAADDSDVPRKRETGAEIYDVRQNDFRAQMQYLKDHGFKVTDVASQLENDPKRIVITFDDGEMSNYEIALPILMDFQFTAYFFVIVNRIGKQGYMGWQELRKLYESGMQVGSHGLSHEILTNLKPSQIEQELYASKRTLQRNLDIEVDSLSIPRGFCNSKVLRIAKEVGYKDVFVSDPAREIEDHCFIRVAVKRHWPMSRFIKAVYCQMPMIEAVGNFVKRSAKFVLRESGYNYFRSLMINIFK